MSKPRKATRAGTLPKAQAKLRAAASMALERAAKRVDRAYEETVADRPGRAIDRMRLIAVHLDAAYSSLSGWQALRAKDGPQEDLGD